MLVSLAVSLDVGRWLVRDASALPLHKDTFIQLISFPKSRRCGRAVRFGRAARRAAPAYARGSREADRLEILGPQLCELGVRGGEVLEEIPLVLCLTPVFRMSSSF